MAEIKEKGHNLAVSNIIVHKINKIGGQKNTALKLADQELGIGKQEIYFVADIRNSFQRKSKPTYGIFEDQSLFNGFQQQLKRYVKGEVDFLSFTQNSMAHYEHEIKKSAPATGAFVVFADFIFKDNSDRYLLIFSINNNQGYNLNEEQLTIQQILNLDLSKLDVAAMINITKWQKFINGDEDGIKSYLSFIKGKKKLSDYFLDFIGCADKSTAADSSKALVTALNSYLDELNYDIENKRKKRKEIFDYCQTCIKERKEVSLDQISYLIDEENPTRFSEFASREEFGVSEVVKPDNTILKTLYFIEYKSDDLTISFSNKMVSNRQIVYNPSSKTLTIKNLPEELISQIEKNG